MRLWPGLLITALLLAGLYLPGIIVPGTITQFMIMMFSPMLLGTAFVLWWVFQRGAPTSERWRTLIVVILGLIVAVSLSHPSIGMGYLMFGVPAAAFAWMLALVFSRNTPRLRSVLVPLLVIMSLSTFTMLRLDGITGNAASEISFRWSKTGEDRLMDSLAGRPVTGTAEKPIELVVQPGDWTGFRGPNRDSRVTGTRIRTDWKKNPPKLIWKKPIGPAWSSFAIVGDYAFTQEQRRENEYVTCYRVSDGSEVWTHSDESRFYETVSGAGPRATPTFANGKLFTMGASGHVTALDAATGKVIWQHDVVKEFGGKIPVWGYSSSPLVVGNSVSVYAGTEGKSVVTFDAETGKTLWTQGRGGDSYVSIHAAKIAGRDVWLSTNGLGLEALDPETGKTLWFHQWDCGQVVRCVQPAVLDERFVAVGTGLGIGTRLISVEPEGDGWKTSAKYTSLKLKPYYNDFVVHKNHAFGFDQSMFEAFNLMTGERKWKAGRYGSGQVIMLADQELLLVVTEESGEIVLVKANPDRHEEIAKFKVVEGKTWNHPVVVRGKLFVRNSVEAACYDISE